MREGWKTVRIGDVCDFVRGLTYKKGDEVEISSNIILRANNISLKDGTLNFDKLKYIRDDIDISDNKKLQKNALLVCTASGSKKHLGKIAFIDDDYDYAFGGFMGLLKPKENIYPKFLYWLTSWKNYSDFITRLSDGVNINNLKFSQLSQFEIPLPTLSEQKCIVAILDDAFEGIDAAVANAEKNLTNARELFESYLNSLLLDVATKPASQTLTSVTELIVDCEHKTAPTQETGIPSIRTPNIGKGKLLLEGVNRVSEKTYKLWTRRGEPRPGDLILAREAPAGNIAVIPAGEKVCLGQRTVLIRPMDNKVDPEFLAFFILHPVMQDRLLAHSKGATVEHVNMKDIRQLPISDFPSREEQSRLAAQIDNSIIHTQHLETIYQKKLADLAELKQSILQKAFSGELTRNSNEGAAA